MQREDQACTDASDRQNGVRNGMEVIPGAWRLFVAVELSREALDELERRQDVLERWARSGTVRRSRREAMHLTLRFIGDVDPRAVPDLREELTGVAARSRSVHLQLGLNDCFPGYRTPRILWTGLDGDLERLESVVASVSGAIVRLDIGEPVRTFIPHVTVARVRGGLPRSVLADIGDCWTYESPKWRSCEVPVSALSLFRSHLGRGVPPRYERLHTAELAP